MLFRSLAAELQPLWECLTGGRESFSVEGTVGMGKEGKRTEVRVRLDRFDGESYDLAVEHPEYAVVLRRRADATALALPRHRIVHVGRGATDPADNLAPAGIGSRLVSGASQASMALPLLATIVFIAVWGASPGDPLGFGAALQALSGYDALAAREATGWGHRVSAVLLTGLMIGMIGTIAPDEQQAVVRRGEAVLNPAGRRAMGDDAIRAANAGVGGSQTIVVQQVYRHRVFDSFVRDNLRTRGPLAQALGSRSRAGQRRS